MGNEKRLYEKDNFLLRKQLPRNNNMSVMNVALGQFKLNTGV